MLRTFHYINRRTKGGGIQQRQESFPFLLADFPLLKEDSMEMILEQAARGKSLLRKQDLSLIAPSHVAHTPPLCLHFCTNQLS